MFDSRCKTKQQWSLERLVGTGRCLVAAVAILALLGVACSETTDGPPAGPGPTGSEPATVTGTGPDTPRPSVLLVTLDTTRADALGCYGRDPSQTPVLDQFAREGTLFTEARTVAPLTLPAHTSVLTGRFPFEHGVRDNGTFQLPDEALTLTEVLAAGGYRTGAVVASGVLNRTYGLDQGFTEYHDLAATSLAGVEVGYRPASEVADLAVEWLGAAGNDGPFFLWAHFFDPHRPLQPPEEFVLQQFGSRANALALTQLQRERGMYAAEVAYMDRELGRILEAAQEIAGEELLVVITSDHGEGNGDHDELTHGYFLYDTTVHVPLLMSGPGVPADQTVEHPVSLVDLMPTVLEMLGLEDPASSGISLRPLLDGDAVDDDDRPMYFETVYPYVNHRWSPLWGLKAGPYKLIDSPRPEFFDLTEDPGELESVFEDHSREVETFRARIASLRDRTVDVSRRELSEEERATLQALGYVGADPGNADGDLLQPGVLDDDLRDTKDCIELIRLHGLAFTHFTAGNFDSAARLMMDAVAEDPDNPHFLDQAGGFLLKADRVREAEQVLQKAVDLEPTMAPSWRSLAQAQRRLGKPAEAIESLKQVIAHDPAAVKARLDLAQLLVQHQGLREEAIALMEQALERLDPDADLAQQVRTKIIELKQQ